MRKEETQLSYEEDATKGCPSLVPCVPSYTKKGSQKKDKR
jgi:hypothetical protein